MINSLETKKYLFIVLAIVFVILGLVNLSALGIDIPLLRQVAGFIFLTFVPGSLILRVLKIQKTDWPENLVYSVGLSVAFVMFIGLFANTVYPLIGIAQPISVFPVLNMIAVVILILCAIVYKQDISKARVSTPPFSINWSTLVSPPFLLLLLLPILSALGALWVYLNHSNVLLLILLSLIVLIGSLVASDKFISTKLFPLAILSMSIALLWHISLVSPYLPGSDVYHELPYVKLTLDNSIWNPNIGSNLNAMASIVMLAPIYSLVLNLDIVWILKIIYPIFFSLVPLALFQAYRRQTSGKIAFLGVFFFVSWPPFFTEIALQAREPVAELFFALSILLFVSKEIPAIKRSTLLIVYGLSIIASHYGTSYLYMLYLLMGLPLLHMLRSNTVNDLWDRVAVRFSKLRRNAEINRQSRKLISEPITQRTLSGTYVMLFVVFCLAWYMYVSSGSAFLSIVRIGDHIYKSVANDFSFFTGKDPHILQALGLAETRGIGVVWEISRIFQYVTQFFIVVGVIELIIAWRKTRFYPEYVAMSLVSMIIIGFSIILPYFASSLNMTRIYHLALFLLAPFCILGGIATFRWLFWILRLYRLQGDYVLLRLVALLVLVPYFLFTTGFTFQLTGATPTSMSLSFYEADWPLFTESEMHASIWLSKMQENRRIYCDAGSIALLSYGGVNLFEAGALSSDVQLEVDSYIFLRRWNVIHHSVLASREQGKAFIYENLENIGILKSSRVDKIYDSKEGQILHIR